MVVMPEVVATEPEGNGGTRVVGVRTVIRIVVPVVVSVVGVIRPVVGAVVIWGAVNDDAMSTPVVSVVTPLMSLRRSRSQSD
jgi:hypothetical protein